MITITTTSCNGIKLAQIILAVVGLLVHFSAFNRNAQ